MTYHPPTNADIDVVREALLWAVEHFECMDQANAKMHCAPVRYSPITFRLAMAYALLAEEGIQQPLAVVEILSHKGMYAEDAGR